MIPDIPNPEETKYFKAVTERLEYMGYISGYTMQAIPFDFRLASGQDLLSKNLVKVLKLMKTFTNKKAVIVAHSMGNTKTMHALWDMNQQDKDDNIHLYLALAPPVLGATKPISYLTCGSEVFSFLLHLGIDMKTWKTLGGTFPGVFKLLPTATYLTQADKPWMKLIQKRIQYEKGEISDPIFDFLPSKGDTCFENFNHKQCLTGLEVFDSYATYMSSNIDNSNVLDWVSKHTFSNFASKDKFYGLFDTRFETIQNLNVPIVKVYSCIVLTEGKFKYNIDPKVRSAENKFCGKSDFSWTN